MAPGVAKSYLKHFYHNLAKAITLLVKLDGEDIATKVKGEMRLNLL